MRFSSLIRVPLQDARGHRSSSRTWTLLVLGALAWGLMACQGSGDEAQVAPDAGEVGAACPSQVPTDGEGGCQAGLHCAYGEACCGGDCSASVHCDCLEDGTWSCHDAGTCPDGEGEDTVEGEATQPSEDGAQDAPDGAGAEGGGDESAPAVDPRCAALVEGRNEGFDVDGKERTFLLFWPEGIQDGGPWPVIFDWHGFGDTAVNMSSLLAANVDDPDFPFVLVVPEDRNLLPAHGMDWEILKVTDPQSNNDIRLFDEVLACLDQRFGVDWDRVYTVGFSAGAILSDLLAVTRQDVIASVISFSGTYFSNAGNVEALGSLSSMVSWPDLEQSVDRPPFVQLLVHGGHQDAYPLGVTTLQFDENGLRDVAYLTGLGHPVIHCDHGLGHTIPAGFWGKPLVQFFAQYPKSFDGAPTISQGLPDYCTLEPAP